MNGTADPLRAAHRLAFTLGLAICFGTPSLIAVLLLSGAVAPGQQTPDGLYQQVGYLFTGVVFLSAAWVWWRSGRMLREFKALPEAKRPAVLLRECLAYAVVFEASCLCGLVYWLLVGGHAARHAWGFILLTPALFWTLVPRYDRWADSLRG